MKYLVHASYLEIYNEEIRDLLSGDQSKKLDIKGTQGVVAGMAIGDIYISGIIAKNWALAARCM